jgi:hypothetical protein
MMHGKYSVRLIFTSATQNESVNVVYPKLKVAVCPAIRKKKTHKPNVITMLHL